VAQAVRTCGSTAAKGRAAPSASKRVACRHTKENRRAPVGIDLRHPWAQASEMPYTGSVDEFMRKRARNDYPLTALWEMGVRKLRVPPNDLLDPAVRERMHALQTMGHEFTVFHFGLPQGRLREILAHHHTLVSALELVLPWSEAAGLVPAMHKLKREVPVPFHLSKLRPTDDPARGGLFQHAINHGFIIAEGPALEAFLEVEGAPAVADGFVFRVGRETPPWRELPAIHRLASSLGVKAEAYVRMKSEQMAGRENDDLANANRVAETAAAALTLGDVDVFLDSLADFDRGYFPLAGLIDTRGNPRMGFHVLRHLYGALGPFGAALRAGEAHQVPGGRLLALHAPGARLALVLPGEGVTLAEVPAGKSGGEDAGASGAGEFIDLVSGRITDFGWRRPASAEAARLVLDAALTCAAPSLLVFR